MAEIPVALLPHRIDVETNSGSSGYDETYDPPVVGIRCNRRGTVQLTADGDLIDPVTIVCRLDRAPILRPKSRVKWDSHAGPVVAYVEAVAEHDDGGLGAWQHLEVVVK